MALQITETCGMFSVHGALNTSNAGILTRHMNMFITPNNPVTLNLERVEALDDNAAYVLQQLYVNAMRNNSILTIIGRENKNILPVLKNTKTTYILGHDRY
tara:strand:- start:157684 stop:157986 length:303 start_codon:yes stop_codon:yes gene_type:complete